MANRPHENRPDLSSLTELSRTILSAEERTPIEHAAVDVPPVDWDEVRSVRGLSIVVRTLLALWVPLGIVALFANSAQRSLLQRVADSPASVRWSEVVADQHRMHTLNWVFVGMLVVTTICFVTWFAVAYTNLDPLGVAHRWTLGWAIGGWFVPILFWWRPKQVTNDLWRSVDASKGDDGMGARPPSILVGCWWTAWVASMVVGILAGRGGATPEDSTVHEAVDAAAHLQRAVHGARRCADGGGGAGVPRRARDSRAQAKPTSSPNFPS